MSESQTVNFSTYGKNFQEKLTFLLLQDRMFCDRMMEVLKVEFLETKYLQWFADKIFEYKKKFKTHPSMETIETILVSSLGIENELLQKQVRDYYAKYKSDWNIENSEFIKSEALDFCRKQKLHEAMLKSVNLLKIHNFDEISKIINSALKAGSEVDDGHDYVKDFEERYIENLRNPIPTGWSQLDEVTSGGLGRGEYGLILAPTGRGKTQLMIHLAAEALRSGKNVVFYSLELSAPVVGKRFDACLTGIPIDELQNNKEEILKKIKDIPGKLIIKQYPKKSVSIMSIKNHISRLKHQNFKLDMIVLDYLDLLKPVNSLKKELRHEIGESYDEFEAICQEENLVGWSASQTNRSGFSSDTISMEQTSEALNKNFGSYLTLGLSRSEEDKQKNTGRITVCKNRSGPDGMTFNIFMDPATVDIKILGLYEPDKSQETQNLSNHEEEMRRLREKYKTYKKSVFNQ